MNTLFWLVAVALFSGCAVQENKTAAKAPGQKVESFYSIDRYNKAMTATIRKIDDRTSPADTVARAALSRCLPELREMGIATTANVHMSPRAQEMFLAQLPSKEMNNATYMVLQMRAAR